MRSRARTRTEELRRVYREHVESVYAYFAYSVGRPAAEDLTAGTFERVVRSWRDYDRRRASERTWILAIARNLLVDHFRRQGLRSASSLDEHPALLEGLVDERHALDATLETEGLRALLAPLGERDREVVALRYMADLRAAEIAQLTGLSVANVHQVLSRSLRLLRERAGSPDGSVAALDAALDQPRAQR